MRKVLVALVLLTAAFTGCLDGDVFQRLREDLEASDRYEDRTLLSQQVSFQPQDTLDPGELPEDPDDLSASWNATIDVPAGTRTLTATFRVNFTTPEPPEESPVAIPRGDVTVFVEGPSGSDANQSNGFDQDGSIGWDFTNPEPGEWTVGMEAVGNGTVTFNVDAIVPVQDEG